MIYCSWSLLDVQNNDLVLVLHLVGRGRGALKDITKIEITSWKVRAYGFYSRVETYQKTKEWARRTSEFSDTLQRVNKNRTKHFP